MRTLDLKQAAAFLKMAPEGLRRKAASGEIPGAKPGKRWCFREDDLADYLRVLYVDSAKASWADQPRRQLCQSANEAISGGFVSITVEDEYKKLLGRETK